MIFRYMEIHIQKITPKMSTKRKVCVGQSFSIQASLMDRTMAAIKKSPAMRVIIMLSSLRPRLRPVNVTLPLLALLLFALPSLAQNTRYDFQATTTTGVGNLVPVLAIPGAQISFYTGCTALPCVTKATTFQSPTSITVCPSTAQVVWQLPIATGCVATADSQGNFGGYFAAGAYQFTETVSGNTYGPYQFNVGNGGGGSTVLPFWFDVRSFGAKVDGSTDDTAAVNAAVSAASAAGGGTVFVPAGVMITQPIQGVSNVGFTGIGTSETTWKLIAGATPVAPSGSGTCSTTASVIIECFTSGWSISNMTIDGNQANQTATSHGIYVSAVGFSSTQRTPPSISNVTVQFAATDGIHIDSPSNGQGSHKNVTVYQANGIGIYAGSFDTQWVGVNVGESGLQGVIMAVASQHFTSVKSWFSGRVTPASGSGIVSLARNNQCDSCEAQDNQFHGIFLDNADNNVFTGVVSTGNNRTSATTGVGVEIQGGNANIVIGNALGGIDFPPSQLFAVEFTSTGNNHVRLTSSGNVNGLINGTVSNEDVLVLNTNGTNQSNFLGSNMTLTGIASLSASTVFDFTSSPFVGCVAHGFRGAPTVSGSVVTFQTDGVHNGGTIECTDDGGTTTIQSVPSTGGTAQTFNLATQFRASGSTFVSFNGQGTTLVLNSPFVTMQNGVLQSGTGGTINATNVPLSGITGGGNPIFRCTSTGTPPQLPSGALTITASNCATSVVTSLALN